MTAREEAILWLSSFVKNKEPMTLIPKQLIRLMYETLKEQPEIVRCKDCKNNLDGRCDNLDLWVESDLDWYCADGERMEAETKD